MEYHCIRCNKWWNYPAKKCILCHGDVVEVLDMKYKIIGYTKVFVPSENHEEVPYFQYLLESEEGNGK
jgi:UDP-2,3-diacylglucosamine pyrophosphatase LpxH